MEEKLSQGNWPFSARLRVHQQNKLHAEHIPTTQLPYACYHLSSLGTEGKDNTAGDMEYPSQ